MDRTPKSKNIERLKLKPCDKCGSYVAGVWMGELGKCKDHWPDSGHEYTHFKIGGQWYFVQHKFVTPLLSLVEVEEGLTLQGGMQRPLPIRIDNLTTMLTLLSKSKIHRKEITKHFSEAQIKRMRGRVLSNMVHPKLRRR